MPVSASHQTTLRPPATPQASAHPAATYTLQNNLMHCAHDHTQPTNSYMASIDCRMFTVNAQCHIPDCEQDAGQCQPPDHVAPPQRHLKQVLIQQRQPQQQRGKAAGNKRHKLGHLQATAQTTEGSKRRQQSAQPAVSAAKLPATNDTNLATWGHHQHRQQSAADEGSSWRSHP
jgi:hypothetical protein